MAKPTGGLLAFSARGSVAKTITFAAWRGRQYVRQHVIPANPRTTSQTQTRAAFTCLSETWKTMPAAVQAVWTLAAKGLPVTDRNLWVKANLALIRGQADDSNIVISTGAKGGLAVMSSTETPGASQITYTAVEPALPVGWSVVALHFAVLHADALPLIVTPVWGYGTDTTSPYSVTVTGLRPGEGYITGGFFEYMKPDGSLAYGPADMGFATPT